MVDSPNDPFDGFVLTLAAGPAAAAIRTSTRKWKRTSAFFGGCRFTLGATMLIADDSPMDRFYDANPSAFISFGESNEKYLVPDLVNCALNGNVEPCFREVGNFKRDRDVVAVLGCLTENCDPATNPTRRDVPAGGTRQSTDPDPLFGMDLFLGSNLSLKNPLYRSFRCGECHPAGCCPTIPFTRATSGPSTTGCRSLASRGVRFSLSLWAAAA